MNDLLYTNPFKTLLLATHLLIVPISAIAVEPSAGVTTSDPPPMAHEAITAARDFFRAVATGDFDRAGKLVAPERYPKDKLQQLKDSLIIEGVTVREAHLGQQQAAVITNDISPRQEGRGRTGRWGVSLRKYGESWMVRDLDFLPSDDAVAKYLANFRKVEPSAERIARQ